jgi:Ca-activated chloride channel family protein
MVRSVAQLEEVQAPVRDGSAGPESSGLGALHTDRGCLPLTDLTVNARIAGIAAEVIIEQTFRNSLSEVIEATYIFPLPDRAAVTAFQMRVKDRVIDGLLKERSQAREDYDAAIREGHRASIAEEDRSGVFSLRVGNLPPREEIVVTLKLVQPIPVSDGEATFRFPLVVAPRYTPGVPLDGPSVGSGTAPDTDLAPDASRISPPVLLPGFPNPVRLSLEVEFTGADSASLRSELLRDLRCSLHSIVSDEQLGVVKLQPGERLDRDFILRYPVASSSTSVSMVVNPSSDESPDTLAVTLYPPKFVEARPLARRVVFLLDRSGSMSGWKMVAARRALGRLIDTLLDHDEFTVLGFDDRIETPPHGKGLVQATNRVRWQTLEWLAAIDARGGTEMEPAIENALTLLHAAPDGKSPILVLVTDGQVSNEDHILRSIGRKCGSAVPRIFTVGIDMAVNGGFLRRLADLGRGDSELVESERRLDEAMDRIHRLIGAPVLTQLRLEPLNFELLPDSQSPRMVPDLYHDRPVTVYYRCRLKGVAPRMRIQAMDAAGRPWRQECAGHPVAAPVLRSLWGRARVRDLEDQYAASDNTSSDLAEQIVAVSLECHVLSRFTAYVAVDKSEVANRTGKPREIVQPVELPAGWDDDLGLVPMQLIPCAAAAPPMLLAQASSVVKYCRRSVHEFASSDFRECCGPPEFDLPTLLNRAVQLNATGIRVERTGKGGPLAVVYLSGGREVGRDQVEFSCWKRLLKSIRRAAGLRAWSHECDCEFTFNSGQGDIRVKSKIADKRDVGLIEIEWQPVASPDASATAAPNPRKTFWR